MWHIGQKLLCFNVLLLILYLYLKIKEKAKRQNQSYVKLPENDLTYLSETKNSKYKIVFYEIHLSEDDKFNNLNINIYFSEK